MIDIDRFIEALSLQLKRGGSRDNLALLKIIQRALAAQKLMLQGGKIVSAEEEKSWSIENAKPGDIISFISKVTQKKWLMIFKDIQENKVISFCSCCIDSYGLYFDEDYYWGETKNVKDAKFATQEEVNTLMKEIHCAGYMWNADKLEFQHHLNSQSTSLEKPNANAFIQVMTDKFKNDLIEDQDCCYIPVDGIVAAYRKGLEDMWNKLKEKQHDRS